MKHRIHGGSYLSLFTLNKIYIYATIHLFKYCKFDDKSWNYNSVTINKNSLVLNEKSKKFLLKLLRRLGKEKLS